MKTKRELYETYAKHGFCQDINCIECPNNHRNCEDFAKRLRKIGAMAILRQNRKKRVFDKSKILTCVTADKAKVGMKGYFADNLINLEYEFKIKEFHELRDIRNKGTSYRFRNEIDSYALFYPIDEVKE